MPRVHKHYVYLFQTKNLMPVRTRLKLDPITSEPFQVKILGGKAKHCATIVFLAPLSTSRSPPVELAVSVSLGY